MGEGNHTPSATSYWPLRHWPFASRNTEAAYVTEIDRLRAVNAELAGALRALVGEASAIGFEEEAIRSIVGHSNYNCLLDAIGKSWAALAKATGGK